MGNDEFLDKELFKWKEVTDQVLVLVPDSKLANENHFKTKLNTSKVKDQMKGMTTDQIKRELNDRSVKLDKRLRPKSQLMLLLQRTLDEQDESNRIFLSKLKKYLFTIH